LQIILQTDNNSLLIPYYAYTKPLPASLKNDTAK